MANVRIQQLPEDLTPVDTDVVAVDSTLGGTTRRVPIPNLGDLVRPLASQPEAEAGSNNTKTMTPLRSKEQIDARLADEATAIAGINATELLTPETGKASIIANAKDGLLAQVGASARARSIQDSYREDVTVTAQAHYDPTDSGMQQAINRAIDAVIARGANGGRVVIPNLGSNYALTGKIILKDNIILEGDGMPTLRLADGVNTSLIEGENFLTLSGTNSGAGVDGWAIRNMRLEGNSANNAAPTTNEGHGIAIYGRDFSIEGVEIYDVSRKGLFTEYGDGTVGISPFNAAIYDILVDTTGEEGWHNLVSDLHFWSINVRSPGQKTNNNYDGVLLGRGVRGACMNVWRAGGTANTHRYALNIGVNGAGTTIFGLHLETAGTASAFLQGQGCAINQLLSYNLLGGDHVILDSSDNDLDVLAFLGGVSGENAAANIVRMTGGRLTNTVQARSRNISGPLVNIVASGGGNRFVGRSLMPSGGTLWSGTPHITDTMDLASSGGTNAEHQSLIKRSAGGGAIAGNGTTQATANIIYQSDARVFPSGANTAVRLPTAIGGMRFRLTNAGAVTALIFPSGTDIHIGGAAGASVNLAAGVSATYEASNTGTWVIA